MVAMARMFTDPVMLRGWDLLDESVRTGETTFDTVFGTDFFGHLKEHPELSASFNEAMSQGTRLTAATVPHHYDFGRFHTLVDIGGGDGTLLASVLREHPNLRGVLFDTAEGLAQAPRRLAQEGLTERVALETGDFFASAPVTATSICSRASSTTGTTRGARPSCGTSARSSPTTAPC